MNSYGRDRWNYRGGVGPLTDTIDHPNGVQQKLPQPFYKQAVFIAGPGTNINNPTITSLGSGSYIFQAVNIGFYARSFVIDNPTGYLLLEQSTQTQIPAGFLGFPVPLQAPSGTINIVVLAGANLDPNATIVCRATEREYAPAAASGTSGGGSSGAVSRIGASNDTSGVVTVGNTATSIVAVRANRWGVYIFNEDATIDMRIGKSTVTATTLGVLVPTRSGISVATQDAVYGIVSAGSITVSFREDY